MEYRKGQIVVYCGAFGAAPPTAAKLITDAEPHGRGTAYSLADGHWCYSDQILGKLEHFDTSVPQDWLDRCIAQTGRNPYGHIVWLYDRKASIFGRPYPVDAVGRKLFAALGVPEDSDLWNVHPTEDWWAGKEQVA